MFMTPLSDFIVMVVEGNVGALTFATACLTIDPVRAVDGLRRMLANGITGSKMCQALPQEFTMEAYSEFISTWERFVKEEDDAMNVSEWALDHGYI